MSNFASVIVFLTACQVSYYTPKIFYLITFVYGCTQLCTFHWLNLFECQPHIYFWCYIRVVFCKPLRNLFLLKCLFFNPIVLSLNYYILMKILKHVSCKPVYLKGLCQWPDASRPSLS